MEESASSIVQLSHVYLDYIQDNQPGATVVEDISLSIKRGEKFVIIGPSGCGKTTLIKAIGGFLKPRHGEVLVNRQLVRHPGPHRTFVFQDFDRLCGVRTSLV